MIALSVGHYPLAPGASFDGRTEHGEASEWVRMIVDTLRTYRVETHVVPVGTLRQKLTWLNALTPQPALAAELHFNSDVSKTQRGCETLYCPGSSKGKRAAEIVQYTLAQFFPPSRGIKEGWYKMDAPGRVDYAGDVEGDEVIDAFLRETRCPAIILEPEFIYNVDTLDTKRDTACVAIARALTIVDEEFKL